MRKHSLFLLAPLVASTLALAAAGALGQRAGDRSGQVKATPDRFYPGFNPEKDALPAARKGGSVKSSSLFLLAMRWLAWNMPNT